MMKKIVILLISFVSLSLRAQQSPGLVLRAAPKGIFISFGKPDFVGKPFELQRKAAGEAAFKTIARVTPPEDIERVREKIHEAAGVFADDAKPSDTSLEKIWTDFRSGNRQVLDVINAVPQLAYIFNVAWLDSEVEAGRKYQYRAVAGASRFDSEEYLYAHPPYFPPLTQLASDKYEQSIYMDLRFPAQWKQVISADVKRKNITQDAGQYKPVYPRITVTDKQVMQIADTSLRVLGAYHYRVQLKDIFGNKDTAVYYFEEDNIPRQWVPEVSDVKIVSAPEARALQLSWSVSAPDRVQSVTLYRSREYDTGYRVEGVFNGTDKSYTDHVGEANELYFYYFEVKDIFGHSTRTVRYHSVYEGSSIPAPPAEVTLTESAQGPQLSWAASDRITRGFYVFRKEGLNGTFVQVSPMILIREGKGAFLDSARLSPEFNYFYAVKSESDTYNQSDFSDTLFYQPAVSRSPAYLKPPYDIHLSYTGTAARLTWENVHDEYPRVLGYVVYRKSEDEKEYRQLTREPLHFSQNMYLDSAFNGATRFSYVIAGVDGMGNTGAQSLPVNLDLSGRFVLVPEETGFAADAKGITLRWTAISAGQIKSIKIYRAEDNGNITLVSTLDNQKTQYRDIAVKKGRSYTYQVATVDLKGRENRAEPLVVNF